MSQKSTLVSDNTLSDFVSEYQSAVSHYNPESSFTLPQVSGDAASAELCEAIANSGHMIFAAPQRELEGLILLANSIFTFSADYEQHLIAYVAGVAAEFESKFASEKKIDLSVVSVVSALSNLFNFTESSSPSRVVLFNKILELINKTNSARLLLPVLDNLANWISESGHNELYFAVYEAVRAQDFDRALLFLERANKPDVLDVEMLNSNKIDIAGVGKYAELIEKYRALPPKQFAAIELPKEVDAQHVIRKQQVYQLCVLAKKEARIAFAEVEAYGVENVEAFLLAATKTGCIKGKINQVERVFVVERAQHLGQLEKEDWEQAKKALLQWKETVGRLRQAAN